MVQIHLAPITLYNKFKKMEKEYKTVPQFSYYEISKDGFLREKESHKNIPFKLGNRGYYLFYNLRKDDGTQTIALRHRLVALAWVENPLNLPIVNHKDENKLNCEADNLEWCTSNYNNTYNDINKKNQKILIEKYQKTIWVYNLNGELIQIIEGVNKCACFIGSSSGGVSSLLKYNSNHDNYRTLKGYYLFYQPKSKENILRKNKNTPKNQKGKKVYQFSLDGEFIQSYPSSRCAAKMIGFSNSYSGINACCRGESEQSHGFLWSYFSKLK